MELYFLRHGTAVDADDWDEGDATRPLTSDGRKDMEREAKAIGKLGLKIECIITSPLTRARETAKIVAERLDLLDCFIEDERLAGNFDLASLAQLLHDSGKKESIMIVGHEPGLSSTIGQLIGGGTVELKKGGLARVHIEDPQTPRGELMWLVPPKVLLQ